MTVRLLTNIGRLWTGSEILSNAAILTQDERITWVGPAAELPESIPGVIDDIVDVDDVQNLNGGLVTPGLIDAHTHPVYAGNRWAELAMRSGGSSATEIAAAGGGMASTVTVTRGTDPWTLCNGVRERLRDWLLSGTTTIEAKTGYHLTRDGELADVRLLRSLESEVAVPRIHVTFLAAHSVPPTGAKGLNLAAADVHVLARALSSHYASGSTDLLDAYSRTALRRVWRAQHFSWWMTSMLHRFHDGSEFDLKRQMAELDLVTSSRAAATAMAESYVGLPLT